MRSAILHRVLLLAAQRTRAPTRSGSTVAGSSMERSRKVNNQVQNELYGDDLRKKSLLGLVAVAVVILLFGFVSSQNGNTVSRSGWT